MNQRVRLLRKELGMTLEKFGAKLGVKKNTLSQIENGKSNVTEQMLKAICREFNVNENWLRNGIGEMFIVPSDNHMSDLVQTYNLNETDVAILETYLNMNESTRNVFKGFISHLAKTIDKSENAVIDVDDSIEDYFGSQMVAEDAIPYGIKKQEEETDIEAEINSYRKELEAETKGAVKSSALPDSKDGNKKQA